MLQIWSWVGPSITFLSIPYLVLVSCVLFLASLGQSLGIRRLYVNILDQVFGWARRITTEYTNQRRMSFEAAMHLESSDSSDDESEDEHVEDSASAEAAGKQNEETSTAEEADGRKISTAQWKNKVGSGSEDFDDDNADEAKDGVGEVKATSAAEMRQRMKTYGKETRHNVISKKDNLLLTPADQLAAAVANAANTEDKIDGAFSDNASVDSGSEQREFELDIIFDYVKSGIGAIIEDEVTQRFVAEELKCWNLLTRTSQKFEFINWKLTMIYVVGWAFRYFVLLPLRFSIFLVGAFYAVFAMRLAAQIPPQYAEYKRKFHEHAFKNMMRLAGYSVSAEIEYHDTHNMCPGNGIVVANHTSPIDVMIMTREQPCSLIGQRHGGFLGSIQDTLSKATDHIWFERSELHDRVNVVRRLKQHVDDPTKLPVLIFPEGTCINNTSVMQFKKGCFEVGSTIYPVAIKYDPKFGDAFWNSSEYSMLAYVMTMMTSWAIVCDVWYLPPMTIREGESAIDFANRVKSEIARKGGLVDLVWDGNLKRGKVKPEWIKMQQANFSHKLILSSSSHNLQGSSAASSQPEIVEEEEDSTEIENEQENHQTSSLENGDEGLNMKVNGASEEVDPISDGGLKLRKPAAVLVNGDSH